MPIDDIARFLHDHPEITGLALDSRAVQPGHLFFAVPGEETDGRRFILDAVAKGASTVLIEAPFPIPEELKVPYYLIPQLKQQIGIFASAYYDYPSHHLSVIGITGTNGKTSTSHFVAQILGDKKKCGLIGTLGKGVLPHLQSLLNTTPSAIDVHHYLSEFLREQHCKAVAMEVSSHALQQFRVNGVRFNTVVFTNLSRDHLDYHGDMEHYWQAKKQLFFFSPLPKNMVINIDDPYGQQLISEVSAEQVVGYRLEGEDETYTQSVAREEVVGCILEFNMGGFQLHVRSPWGQGRVQCPLLGRFNASNLLAAITTACLEGMPFDEVLAMASRVESVPGRMMRFGGSRGLPLVVIDYAHTPDALSKVLKALKDHCQGKLWCVFGCGGDRDRGKRPLMTKAALAYSDYVIMTQDNPRTEDPKQIFSDMMEGCEASHTVQIEYDRTKAINNAILNASFEDIIVVAGKGHEEYQLIGSTKIPYKDETTVRDALARRK